ncbi:MAG: serine/threonine protein kinase [Deltaproteobacteria bacterium]|nr:serine/threonine protein kinase [Deltaproteobacteria bacterium]
MSPTRPKNIGSCALKETIGKGGMAEVILGEQEQLDRKVAVKALLPELKNDKNANARFHREAEALALLQHENIVAVHDLVEKYNRLYMIMEYVDGVDLFTISREGPVPIDIGLIIGVKLASALEHAHFRKVLHRDIKPANVMLSRTGQVKLTDFGIAKDQTKDDLTRKGLVVGTLAYLSPEQVSGQRADWRSDIYSLGVLLFETLSGTRLFTGKEQGLLVASIVKGEHEKLRQRAPRIPRSVEKIVHRCLEADPAKRYQRAADVRRSLERLLNAVLEGTPSARIVAFLKERGQIDEQAMTVIAGHEVAATRIVAGASEVLDQSKLGEPPIKKSFARKLLKFVLIMLITFCVVAGGLAATYALAPDWSRQIAEKVVGLMKAEPAE